MSRFMLLVLIAGAIVLVMSGVLQVNFNAEKIPGAPAAVGDAIGSKKALERPRTYVVRIKRVAEAFFVDNESEKIDVALDHVEQDAERLIDLMDRIEDASALIPQTEMLISSLDRAKKQSREVSPEVLVRVKNRTEEVYQLAYGAFVTIDQKQDSLAGETSRLAATIESLQQEVGGLVDFETAVAGAENRNDNGAEGAATSDAAPAETIPLTF